MSRTIQFVDTDPEPGSNYTPAYREFFERLRRARIEKGLSLFEVAELVGLQLSLAYEVENLIAPLPFEWLEVWCKVVGVPFEDYLAVYWAMEEAGIPEPERSRCIAGRKANQHKNNGRAQGHATTPDPEHSEAEPEHCGAQPGTLSPLRAALDRAARFFRSRFSTP
jgi:transcriptional regulator with XRE-family HTH domain